MKAILSSTEFKLKNNKRNRCGQSRRNYLGEDNSGVLAEKGYGRTTTYSKKYYWHTFTSTAII